MKTSRGKLLGALLFLAGILLTVYDGYLLLGIPLALIGLVLFLVVVIRAHEEKTDLKKPAGVNAIGIFTLIGSIGLGFYVYLIICLSGVGSFGFASAGISAISESTSRYLFFLILFALAGFLLSILVLRGLSSKNLWYALMAYWTSLLALSFARDFINLDHYITSFWLPSFLIFVFPTYVYPAICIAYFLTKKPRKYFHLIAENNLTQQTTV